MLAESSESDIIGSEEASSEEVEEEEEPILDAEEKKRNAKQDDFLSDSHESDKTIDDSNEYVFVGQDMTTVWSRTPYASKPTCIGKGNNAECRETNSRRRYGSKKHKITNEVSALFEIIDGAMLEQIVACTNLTIEHKRQSSACSTERGLEEMTRAELLALIGLLYLLGMKRANNANLLELWTHDGTGLEICRSTMACRRFTFLLDCLRFDDRNDMTLRLQQDKLAPVRYIWERFMRNCGNSYVSSGYFVIGKRLQTFPGSKCSFVQLAKGTGKYGLQTVVLQDVETLFTCNMELCCGQQPDGPYRVSDDIAAIVHRLLEHAKAAGSDCDNVITCDPSCTTYPLALSLLDDGVKFVGPLGRHQQEVPLCFLSRRDEMRPAGSSIFSFRENIMLVSHVPHDKHSRNLALLSTAHHDMEIDSRTDKPKIVEDYEVVKTVVDTIERTCAMYSISGRAKKWPLAVFFMLLNVAGMNAQILHNVSWRESPQKNRKIFLKNLALALLKPQLQERMKIKFLPFNIRTTILHQVRKEIPQEDEQGSSIKRVHEAAEKKSLTKKRGKCFMCIEVNVYKTTYKCDICSNFVCKRHRACMKYICGMCETDDV